MNCLIIGYGEIGRGVVGAYESYHKFDIIDPIFKVSRKIDKYDVMCVAIPYSENFVEIVRNYKEKYDPDAIIIFSTVEVGTTSQIPTAVHVPIEGKHPYLVESIKKWQVFMGGRNKIAYKFFADTNKLVYQLDKPEHSEFLKLQSTTNYMVALEYARYVSKCCENIGLNYNEVQTFNLAYNQLYKSMGAPNYQRYILTAPEGKIGGHCLLPNSKILQKQFPSKLIDVIREANE